MFRFRKEVYLDNNATTIVDSNVRKRINYVLEKCYGNPSSLYRIARDSAVILEESREQVAKSINATPTEIIFTGSASEANNTVLKVLSEKYYPSKKKILSTPIEHASVTNTLNYLKSRGMEILYLPVDKKGTVKINDVEKLIDSETLMICCMYANNELGTIQDIKGIVGISRKHNLFVMSDCVQALGKIKVDVKELDLDYAIFSAHKIHGPKGVGALYVKDGCPISPFIHGGHQENGLRAGTEGLHNIAGFAQACKKVDESVKKSSIIKFIKETFVSKLKKIDGTVIINSSDENCLPNTVSVTFQKINNSVLMAVLDYHGVSVSAGSACNTQSNDPSHILKAVGLTDEQARQTLRFSFSASTSLSDIKYVLRIIKDFVENKLPPISVIQPGQLNENILFSEKNYVLDVRFWHDRKMLKGIPNSYEASFILFKNYIKNIPKNKNIVVICQFGFNSPVVAYYLRLKGYKNVGFLMGGLAGWKIFCPELYSKYGGQNITKLKPRGIS